MRLELGSGSDPTPDFVHHDRTIHSEWIDIAWDLEVLPWPWADDSVEVLHAIDVMEHLRLEVFEWLGECWRILEPGGLLVLRLPAWDNPLSWRDPTHRRVFHPQSMDYFDPDMPLFEEFGRYYEGAESGRWWKIEDVGRGAGASRDFVYRMRKR